MSLRNIKSFEKVIFTFILSLCLIGIHNVCLELHWEVVTAVLHYVADLWSDRFCLLYSAVTQHTMSLS